MPRTLIRALRGAGAALALAATAIAVAAPPASAHSIDEIVRSSAGCGWSSGGYDTLHKDAVRTSDGRTLGAVVLLWSGTYGENCVITQKTGSLHGVTSTTAAYLYIQGASTRHDIDDYAHYAAVSAPTAGRCVHYEGSIRTPDWSDVGFGGRDTWGNCG
ncbi:hypothetical protein [Marinitenerispora sediminis]|uniref:Spore-associated protein A n=1 Tax=Marinitenerispora sediminis TaxID=1931232 RepID=A0A368T1H9_9ACTN|nr:hypothetical protein [Marinitenerispora sediminis]RCV51570.1 hypothetical protein DEF28_15220 [Marinitenerispora sediminis]RCV54444.1 hypothetical protein DEF24_19230 [Marinitenerispora sediminis]RCV55643.1 hypothetical protein DEF23_14015 [Marinitenerispora sediminis]